MSHKSQSPARNGARQASTNTENPANSATAVPAQVAILAEHAAEIRRLAKRVIGDVIEIGQRLKTCKGICGHGKWLPWLDREFGWSADTAERFIRLAKLSDQIPQIAEYDLPLSGLYLLAKPSTPDEARDEIIERAKAGEAVSTEDIKETIASRKPPTDPRIAAIADAAEARSKENQRRQAAQAAGGNGAEPQESAGQRKAEAAQADKQPAKRGLVTGVAMAPHAERGPDLYETPPVAVRALLDAESISGTIWEPACGPGAIVRVLRDARHQVIATDLVDYGCPDSSGGIDFLAQTATLGGATVILTNPPYRHANRFVRHALKLVPRVVMLLPLRFLEGEGRADILDGGKLARVCVFRNRLPMMHRAGWDGPRIDSGAVAFAWFVWSSRHQGPATLRRVSWKADDGAVPPPRAADEDLGIPAFLRRTAEAQP